MFCYVFLDVFILKPPHCLLASSQPQSFPLPPCFMFHATCSRHPFLTIYLDLMFVPYPIALLRVPRFVDFWRVLVFFSFCGGKDALDIIIPSSAGRNFSPLFFLSLSFCYLPTNCFPPAHGPIHLLPPQCRLFSFFYNLYVFYRIVYYYITFQRFFFFFFAIFN